MSGNSSLKPLHGKDCWAVFCILADSTLEKQEGVTGSRFSDTSVQSADGKIGTPSWGRWGDTERTGRSCDHYMALIALMTAAHIS